MKLTSILVQAFTVNVYNVQSIQLRTIGPFSLEIKNPSEFHTDAKTAREIRQTYMMHIVM